MRYSIICIYVYFKKMYIVFVRIIKIVYIVYEYLLIIVFVFK